MAELHMNTDSCEAVAQKINATKDQIVAELTALQGAVGGMVGADWVAPGATQFKGDYDDWHNKVQSEVNTQLEALMTRLRREIQEWIASGQNA
jgi:uncharacterized protein YukE